MAWRPIRRLVMAALLLAAAAAWAVEPSDVSPSDNETPRLTVIHDGERRVLSLAAIESLGLVDAEIRHFDGPEGVFTGETAMTDWMWAITEIRAR